MHTKRVPSSMPPPRTAQALHAAPVLRCSALVRKDADEDKVSPGQSQPDLRATRYEHKVRAGHGLRSKHASTPPARTLRASAALRVSAPSHTHTPAAGGGRVRYQAWASCTMRCLPPARLAGTVC